MSGADERVVTVRGLKEGRYVFQLTVTDDKGLTDSDTVAVNVKKGAKIPSLPSPPYSSLTHHLDALPLHFTPPPCLI